MCLSISALPFQTRLTQTKPVLPLSNEHDSQVKDQGQRQCCHNKHKKFPYRPTRDVSLLSGHTTNNTITLLCKCSGRMKKYKQASLKLLTLPSSSVSQFCTKTDYLATKPSAKSPVDSINMEIFVLIMPD